MELGNVMPLALEPGLAACCLGQGIDFVRFTACLGRVFSPNVFSRRAGRGFANCVFMLMITAAAIAALDGDDRSPLTRLFDGQSLDDWSVIEFAGHGGASVTKDGCLQVDAGYGLSGVVYEMPILRSGYEVVLSARRISGDDFFCGLTVPVGNTHCTLIVGGWGGSVFGISSIDGLDASENETSCIQQFDTGRWYRIRFRVSVDRLMAWLDGEKLIDLSIEDRRISLRPGAIRKTVPFGLTTFATTAQFRNIRLRELGAQEN